MLVFESTYNLEVLERRTAQHQYAQMLAKYNELVKRINRHGGEDLFRGKPESNQFSKEEINKMIALCHPDKHNGKKTANDITRRLLEFR